MAGHKDHTELDGSLPSGGGPFRIVALLCWYDEPVEDLRRCVWSLQGLVDHLVAVDGAYAMFPHDAHASSEDQAVAIMEAAGQAGIDVTVCDPVGGPWRDQCDKRSFAFTAGGAFAQPGRDWFLVIDADEAVRCDARRVRKSLQRSNADVAMVDLVTMDGDGVTFNLWEVAGGREQKPRLFRAQEKMWVQQSHNAYLALKDGKRVLLNGFGLEADVGAVRGIVTFVPLVLQHYILQRGASRSLVKAEYYRERRRAGSDVPGGESEASLRAYRDGLRRELQQVHDDNPNRASIVMQLRALDLQLSDD